MMNNKGILSTSALLNGGFTSSTNKTRHTPPPPMSTQESQKQTQDVNSQNQSNSADLNSSQQNDIASANAAERNPSKQANQQSAQLPSKTEEGINKETQNPGYKQDTNIPEVKITSADPQTMNTIDDTGIEQSNPEITQPSPVPNSDRANAVDGMSTVGKDSPPSTNTESPNLESQSTPRPKEATVPDASTPVPDNPRPRQRFHNMPAVDANMNVSRPSPNIPNPKTPKASMSRTPQTPKMRMPSLRIPKMR